MMQGVEHRPSDEELILFTLRHGLIQPSSRRVEQEHDDEIDLQSIIVQGLRFTRRWWKFLIILTVVGLVVGGVKAYRTPDVYEAQAMVFSERAAAETVAVLAWSPSITREVTAGWETKPVVSPKTPVVTLVTRSFTPEGAVTAAVQWMTAVTNQKRVLVQVFTEPVQPMDPVAQRRDLMVVTCGLLGFVIAVVTGIMTDFARGVRDVPGNSSGG